VERHGECTIDDRMPPESPKLIDRLRDPGAFPHAVEEIQVRETHISWVILTGEYAYKIKKPVRFEFLDFSTLERRRHYCEEELRLNRRYAPDLYLDVVPITDSADGPRVGAEGDPFEFAVRMQQFDERELLDRCLREDRLTVAHVDAMGRALADFHTQAERAPVESRFGRPELILEEARENFSVLTPRLTVVEQRAQLERLARWTEREVERLRERFEARRRKGRIRECHGDLHLGNMFLQGGQVTFFDGIEFNEDFRWIDVMSELAFAVMDLMDRGRRDLGNRLLNAYLERSGDYAGLDVVPFYVVYRALVRAKVDALRMDQAGTSEGSDLPEELRSYLDLAEQYTQRPAPRIIITCGVSGSGKTTGSQALVDRAGLIRVRSDVERKRLLGIDPADRASGAIIEGAYGDAATRETYNRLEELARRVVRAGYGVVVDATFLHASQRVPFQNLADSLETTFHIIEFEAEPAELRRRVADRQERGGDASDAGIAVLEHQFRTREPLTGEERRLAIGLEKLLSGERDDAAPF
jgi:aminoglycoside phosphotransferase family enzyme